MTPNGQSSDSAPQAETTTRYPEPYHRTLLGQIDERWLANRHARRIFAGILILVLVVASIGFVRKIRETKDAPFRDGGERQRSALGRWLPDAEELTRVHEGGDPYGKGHWFPTPPMVLMTLVPLSKMSYTTAGIIWAALKLLGLAVAITMLVRSLGPRNAVVPVGVLIMAAIFATRPIFSDITHGNLNIFMFVWVGIAWALFVRGKDLTSGLFVALAIVTKVTPGLLLLYFIYKRAWRVCIGAASGLALFVAVLPSLYLGVNKNIELHRDWFNMLVAPYAIHGYVTREIPNQSLYGVSVRLLSNAGILRTEDMPLAMAETVGMEDMVRPVTLPGKLIRPCMSLTILGLLAFFCRAPTRDRRDLRLWLEVSLVLIAMLLMSERTWKHHATTLPLVYLTVWYALTCLAWSDRFRAWFVAGLVAQLFLLVGTSEGLLGDRLARLTMDGGVFCWGLLLCAIQIGIMLWRFRRAADLQSGVRPKSLSASPGRS